MKVIMCEMTNLQFNLKIIAIKTQFVVTIDYWTAVNEM